MHTGFLLLAAAVACALSLVWPALAAGGSLQVSVTDRDDQPVDEVLLYAVPKNPVQRELKPVPTAVMAQADRQFSPGILVVETGTPVEFPNLDSVSHHVYSFSDAKSFELPLYKGSKHPPITFDTPGVVVLGCNIHDSMLGYVVVLDTPHFALTNLSGLAELDGLADGEYAIHVWTPRLREQRLPRSISIGLNNTEEQHVAFQFDEKLFPTQVADGGSLTWSDY